MDADLQELMENELDVLIKKAHNSGLNYWEILTIVLKKGPAIQRLSGDEYYLKGGR